MALLSLVLKSGPDASGVHVDRPSGATPPVRVGKKPQDDEDGVDNERESNVITGSSGLDVLKVLSLQLSVTKSNFYGVETNGAAELDGGGGWDPDKHPRDEVGRFTSGGGGGGGTGGSTPPTTTPPILQLSPETLAGDRQEGDDNVPSPDGLSPDVMAGTRGDDDFDSASTVYSAWAAEGKPDLTSAISVPEEVRQRILSGFMEPGSGTWHKGDASTTGTSGTTGTSDHVADVSTVGRDLKKLEVFSVSEIHRLETRIQHLHDGLGQAGADDAKQTALVHISFVVLGAAIAAGTAGLGLPLLAAAALGASSSLGTEIVDYFHHRGNDADNGKIEDDNNREHGKVEKATVGVNSAIASMVEVGLERGGVARSLAMPLATELVNDITAQLAAHPGELVMECKDPAAMARIKSLLTSGGRGITQHSGPIAAGLCVKAEDTGRVLMIQRSMADASDPARGKWEFPGGHLEAGEEPVQGAQREWEEETGLALPLGHMVGKWTAPNGKYAGFCYVIPSEGAIRLNREHGNRANLNPDDPDGDDIEVAAWQHPGEAEHSPGTRTECRIYVPWAQIKQA